MKHKSDLMHNEMKNEEMTSTSIKKQIINPLNYLYCSLDFGHSYLGGAGGDRRGWVVMEE